MVLYLVDGQRLDSKWNTVLEGTTRLDHVIELYRKKVGIVLLMGWKATTGIDKRHCDAWLEYLLSKWDIPQGQICIEKDKHWSLDTVWELVFAMNEHSELIKWAQEIVFISSDYHKERALEVIRVVLGDIASKVIFEGVPRHIHKSDRSDETEQASLNAFKRDFVGVRPWAIQEITDRMWQTHPLYQNHPSNPRLQKNS